MWFPTNYHHNDDEIFVSRSLDCVKLNMMMLLKSFVLNNYHQPLPVSFDNCRIDSWQKANICFIIEIGALK